MELYNKKILFADLDGTLIQTASGKTFAEDCTDFRIRKDVLDKIRWMPDLEYVLVVTNQGGIPEYISKQDFETKFDTILYFLNRYMCMTLLLMESTVVRSGLQEHIALRLTRQIRCASQTLECCRNFCLKKSSGKTNISRSLKCL